MKSKPRDPDLDKIVLLLVTGVDAKSAREAATSKLGIPKARAVRLIAEAAAAIQTAADYHRDHEIGTAYIRLNDLYVRSLRINDTKTALAAQRELNRLLRLYDVSSDDAPETDAESTIALIASHLLPLGLATESYPLPEHARLAADIVRRTQEPDGS